MYAEPIATPGPIRTSDTFLQFPRLGWKVISYAWSQGGVVDWVRGPIKFAKGPCTSLNCCETRGLGKTKPV